MKEYTADLHLHSKYAGGVSKNMEIPVIAEQSRLKGLEILCTGDILHAKWLENCKKNLEEESNGIYRDLNAKCNFIIGGEIEDNKRVHHLFYLPSLEGAQELREKVLDLGALDCSMCGRPKLRLGPEQFAEKVSECGGIFGPAHSFTPYTGIYAYHDSLKKAYGKMHSELKFIELGLSADTQMADKMSENHSYAFLSSSDAHCVHPDSMITLADGRLIKITGLWEKQEVIACFDFEKNEPTVATYKIMQKSAPEFLFEIEANTKKVKVTPEHRFFTFSPNNEIVEKCASELNENEWIAINNSVNFCEKEIPIIPPLITKYYKLDTISLQKLREKRNELKITRKQMESKLGLKNDYYWRLEKGQHKMNENVFNSSLQILGFKEGEIKIEGASYLTFPQKLNNEKLCELLGYIIGDGCHEKGKNGNQLSLTDKNNGLLEYYSKVAKELFNEDRKVSEKDKYKDSYRLRLSQSILKFFQAIDKDLLITSKNRKVPEKVFFLGRKETAAFLRGYFDAEGSIGHHHVDACSANKLLLLQIQSLLLKFGINSSIYKNFEKIKKKYRYRLHIYGQENLLKFQNGINFNHQIKKIKLSAILSKIVQKPKHTYLKICKNMLWAKVAKISKAKADCKWVYDLSVSGYENYVVGGFITHNSPWPNRLGREFNRIKMKKPDFASLKKALESRAADDKAITLNAGLNPREGKYHCTACESCFSQYALSQAEQLKWKCLKCRHEIKRGVRDRIEMLADTKSMSPGFRPPYLHLLPLVEIIQLAMDTKSPNTKAVQSKWRDLIEAFGNEIYVLVDAKEGELREADEGIAKKIMSFRQGLVLYIPGGGGNYGKPIICNSQEELEQKKAELAKELSGVSEIAGQKTLGQFL